MAVLALVSSLVAIFVVSRIIKFRNALRKVGHTPGMRVAFAPISFLGSLLPSSRWNPGLAWQWEWRNQVYPRYGSETISVVPWLFGRPFIYTSSMEVARQVVSTAKELEKGAESTSGVSQYGANLFTTNGSEWRRHRRIMGPAFSQETYALIWAEASSLYREMSAAEGWNNKDKIVIPSVTHYTNRFGLTIISRCGFGIPLLWKSLNQTNVMGWGEALEIVSNTFIDRLVAPRWMYWLPIKHLRDIDMAYKTLTQHMHALIKDRRENLAVEGSGEIPMKRDVFSLLVRASEAEDKLAMTDDELMGNTFFLLFAGHETMTHTWDATLGFLALYEDIQEEARKEILEVAPANSPLTYADGQKLTKTLACFLEASRLFPSGFILMRDTVEDVVLPSYNSDGSKGQIAVERGVCVAVDMVGLHANPRHFPDPEEYRPSRWYGANENELSTFSVGPRACIGRRFALTEATCLLAHLLREWKLEIILQPGETRPQWRKRVMRGKTSMTLGVDRVSINLVRLKN